MSWQFPDDVDLAQPQLKEMASTPKICLRCNAEIDDSAHTCIDSAVHEWHEDSAPSGHANKTEPQEPPSKSKGNRQSAGTQFGQYYTIECFIGEGGMSSVYKARHTLMKRTVALKILHPQYAGDQVAWRRFQQEAQAAGSLDHPNIIKVHDFGCQNEVEPYLVMDYVEGISLSELIHGGGPLDVERAIKILKQACDALDHAHSKGVVHRDLKPSNIMLVQEKNNPDFVKLLDFGIAKVIDIESGASQKLTQTGEVFGSPLYMSPEQCQSKKLDGRSDIYAMGCLMYEALTGRPPLVGGNVFETFYKQTHEMPESISKYRPEIKSANKLDAVILKCMAKSPSGRYRSMQDLKRALEKLEQADTGGVIDRFKDKLELNRAKQTAHKTMLTTKARIGIAATVLVLACVTGMAGYFGGTHHLSSMGTIAEQWQRLDSEGQEAFNAGNLSEAEQKFRQALLLVRTNNGTTREHMSSLEGLVDLAHIQKDKSKEDAARAELVAADANLLTGYAEEEKAIEQEVKRLSVSSLSAAEANKNWEDIVSRANDLAIGLSDHPDRSKQILLFVLDGATRSLSDKSPVVARTLHNLGVMNYQSGNKAEAKGYFSRALKIYEETGKEMNHPSMAKTIEGLAISDTTDLRTSKALLERALSMGRTLYEPTPAIASVRMDLASLYLIHNDLETAKKEAQLSLQLYKSLPGQDDQIVRCHLILGDIAKNQNDFGALKTHCLEAIKILQASDHKDYRDLAWCLAQIGSMTTTDQNRADALHRRALAIYDRIGPSSSAGTVVELRKRLNLDGR